MTKRATILIVAIIALVVFTAMCASSNGAQAAVRKGVAFTDRGTPIHSFVASGSGSSLCWGWRQGWEVTNFVGTRQYGFQVDVQWCSNGSKVTKIVYNYCVDIGGYFDFDWCHKQKGATGYASIGMYTDWHYHFTVNNIFTARHPSVRFDLYATGRVTGTVYYDN